MKTIQDMIDNHDGEYYSGNHSVDADWNFYDNEVQPFTTLRVFFSASAMVDRFTAHMGIDRSDALERVRDMVHAVTYHECRMMQFDLETDYSGDELLFITISEDYNGEDMEALTRRFDPAVERVAYYVSRIEDPDLR